MKQECLELLIDAGREIEFVFEEKHYSITYYNDNRKDYISFCEFYKEPIDVGDVQDLLKIKIGKLSLGEIFKKLPDSAIDIY